jgi:hypothetical protein
MADGLARHGMQNVPRSESCLQGAAPLECTPAQARRGLMPALFEAAGCTFSRAMLR